MSSRNDSRRDSHSDSRADLIAQLIEGLREWSTWTVLFHSGIAQKLGLHTTDHKCLDVLLRVGPVNAGYLAELTGLTTGAITGVIDRLERAGLVRREPDPNDRRRVLIAVNHEEASRRIGAVVASLPLPLPDSEFLSQYSDDELALLRDFVMETKERMRQAVTKMQSQEPGRSAGE